jgi:hypothetical protein
VNELRDLLNRIADSANAAQAHYQIWFTLRGNGKALPSYYNDMNDHRYVDFFHASNSGNYKLMFLELGCLFDTDTRAASFRNLKEALKKEGRHDLIERINTKLSPFSKLVSSALTIRSKLIAHKEVGAESEHVHSINGVVPNEIGQLLNIASSLINEIDVELFGNTGCLMATTTDRFERATFEMLEVLRNGRS